MAYQTINPYTNEVEQTFENTTDEELEQTLATAHQLYLEWRRDNKLEERKRVILNLGRLLRERREEYAAIMTRDMGKLIGEAEGEVDLCASFCDYYVANADQFLAPEIIATTSGRAKVIKQSLGTLVAVEPWNFPFYQIARVFIPNFIVGNPMILKDASNCPASAQAFADAVKEAGAPAGSLTNLFLSYDQVNRAIADKRVAGVCLTGSERGGATVAKEAGAYLKKNTMELGGNDAFIILDEAQNTTPEQMKMFLTRMGVGSKVVVTGDVTQIDLPGSTRSGLVDALKVLKDVNGIAQCYFTDKDVVRHRLVQEIVKAYERAAHPAADAENKENNKNFK